MVTEDERIAALELRVAALEDLLEKVAVRYGQEVENAVRGRARLSAILDDAQFAGSGAGVPYDEIGRRLFHIEEMPPGATLTYDKDPE